MNGFLSNLTAALLALHTVLGCCCHHAHASAADGCQSEPSLESHEGHCPSDCSDTTHGEHKPHFCKQISCVFLASTKWSDLLPACDTALSGAALTDADLLAKQTSVSAAPFFEPDALLPPLRIHLLDRVLLL